MMADMRRRKLSPGQVARRFGVGRDTVMKWIRSGELRAIDASTAESRGRARYLVDLDDLAAFEAVRVVVPHGDSRPEPAGGGR